MLHFPLMVNGSPIGRLEAVRVEGGTEPDDINTYEIRVETPGDFAPPPVRLPDRTPLRRRSMGAHPRSPQQTRTRQLGAKSMTASKKRATPPSAYDIAHHWAFTRNDFRLIDIGEPACMACGWYPGWEGGTLPEDAEPDNIRKRWDAKNSRLERAHLTPHSLDGSNDVSNYVMLCSDCHREAPNFRYREVMVSWVARRESCLEKRSRELTEAADAMGARSLIERFCEVDPTEFRERLAEEAGANASYHFGDGINVSTWVAVGVSVLRQMLAEHDGALFPTEELVIG